MQLSIFPGLGGYHASLENATAVAVAALKVSSTPLACSRAPHSGMQFPGMQSCLKEMGVGDGPSLPFLFNIYNMEIYTEQQLHGVCGLLHQRQIFKCETGSEIRIILSNL